MQQCVRVRVQQCVRVRVGGGCIEGEEQGVLSEGDR